MAYSDKVVDHYEHPRNVGSLPKDDPNVGTGLVGAPECGDVMKLQTNINSETQVIEEAGFKTFGCDSAIANSSLATEWVKGKTARKRWPSRTRISSASSAFPRATLLDVTRYSLARHPARRDRASDRACCPEGQRYVVLVAPGFSPARPLSACRPKIRAPRALTGAPSSR